MAVVGSGAPIALLEGLLVARSALEGGEAGRPPIAPPTPTADDGECGGGTKESPEEKRAQPARAGEDVRMHTPLTARPASSQAGSTAGTGASASPGVGAGAAASADAEMRDGEGGSISNVRGDHAGRQ